jgi:hypothetical protein
MMQKIRRFETRYPTTTTKALPTTSLWTFINSAFFIWLTSTVLIGLATFTYSEHRACETNFEKYNDTFVRLLSEYQFRTLNFEAALVSAKSDADVTAAEAWMAVPPGFIHADYKSRTFADINMDLIRTFAELSLYSDITDFAVTQDRLSVSYQNRSGNELKFDFKDISKEINLPSLLLSGGPSDLALRTALIIQPHADCGLKAIARRTLFSSDERYSEQATKAYDRLRREEFTRHVRQVVADITKAISGK